jgi:hypothetical protein
MIKHPALSALLAIFGLALHAGSYGQSPVLQWDRNSAMAAVRAVDIDAAVYEISELTSLADGVKTLARLKQIETRSDWPLPAREAVVYQFTRSLAELPRDAVATEVMQHLRNYQAQTLVPHEDHGEHSVPLFNIRAAAAGVESGWQRAESGIEAAMLLETNPTALVSAYIASTHPIQQAGYLDALQHAGIADVVAVQNIALEQLGESPGLTPMLGVTATLTSDVFAVEQLLVNGRGQGLSSTLKKLDKRLQIADTAALLDFAIQQAPASNATLAIAAWWPRLKHDSVTRDLMIDLLTDPTLGASASLALAQSPDIQTIKALQDIAKGDSVAAQRAQMALDLNRAGLIAEVHP